MSNPSISYLPPGLLGALQIKGGANPRTLIETYQPVLEMRDWLLLAAYEVLGVTNAGGVTNGFAGFTSAAAAVVPVRQWWYVHDFSINIPGLVATDVIHAAPAYQLDVAAGGDTFIAGASERLAPGAGGGAFTCFSSRAPFFVPQGALFGAWILESIVAAPRDLGIRIRYTPLPL